MAFILVAFGVSYEDAWRKNVAVSRELEKIVALKEAKESRIKVIDEIRTKLEEFTKEWEASNPFDQASIEKLVEIPKWPSGIDQRLITKEMRAERQSIKDFNEEVNRRNSERHTAYRDRRLAAEIEFLRPLGLFELVKEENISEGYYSIAYRLYCITDRQYEIEEVEEI